MATSNEYVAAAAREVVKTITEKCEVLGKMLEASRVKLQSARDAAEASVFEQKPLLREMDDVFGQLQGTPVDPVMVGGELGKTLFDFIDAETVASLQQDALEQSKDIEELLGSHEHALGRIEAIYTFFTSFHAAHAGEIAGLVRQQASPTSGGAAENKQVAAFYDVAVNFFVDMEQCDRLLLRYFTTINDIYPHYEVSFAEVQLLFDELRSLRDFYRQFVASYERVGPELERRKAYEQQLARTIADMRARLARLEDQETQERIAFCGNHDRFLPSTLCPEIKELPRRFDVVAVDEHDDEFDQSVGSPRVLRELK